MISEVKIFAPASVANVSCGFDVLGFCLEPVGDLIHVKMNEKRICTTRLLLKLQELCGRTCIRRTCTVTTVKGLRQHAN